VSSFFILLHTLLVFNFISVRFFFFDSASTTTTTTKSSEVREKPLLRSSHNVVILSAGAGKAKIASQACNHRSCCLAAWRASVPSKGPLFRFPLISIILACTFSSFI
jgi:hypothetical protein